jgi:hypothetical protein
VLEALYNAISKLFSWRWPTTEGEILQVDVETASRWRYSTLQLAVAYKFSVGDDGPYTGEYSWQPGDMANDQVVAAKERLQVGQAVTVCYRPDDPSVSTLDSRAWKDL